MSVVTRFAPSPTGYLHVGGARTALYSWLAARQAGGQFILRIEDTDRERSTDESVQAILDGMKWLQLDFDQGPFYQTQRFDRYKAVVQQLLDEGKAYYCYCTPEELDEMREAQREAGEKPRYDGRYREFDGIPPEGVDPVIRFKNPQAGEVSWEDAIKGTITIANAELDDLIIARSDGTPTYNLTVVVDDIDMGLTHVIRGDDHVNNTPRQINLYTALGAELPVFAHAAMILGEDGKRLSKRHGAVSVLQYRDEGYLPEALLNYLVRLGWSHGDQEVFTRDELIELFKVEDVNRAPSTFNPEKLAWLNQQTMQAADPAYVAQHLGWHFERLDIDTNNGPELTAIVKAFSERAQTLVEMAEAARFLYEDFDEYEAGAAKKHLSPVALEPLQKVAELLAALPEWTGEAAHQAINETAEALEVGMGKVGMPLRVAVAGCGMSPSHDVTLSLLGREKTLARIDRAIEFVKARAEQA